MHILKTASKFFHKLLSNKPYCTTTCNDASHCKSYSTNDCSTKACHLFGSYSLHQMLLPIIYNLSINILNSIKLIIHVHSIMYLVSELTKVCHPLYLLDTFINIPVASSCD